jgi:hypothetical protein
LAPHVPFTLFTLLLVQFSFSRYKLRISEDSRIISTTDACGPNIIASLHDRIIITNETKILNFSNPLTSLTVTILDSYNQVMCTGYPNVTMSLWDEHLIQRQKKLFVNGVAEVSGYFVTTPYYPGERHWWVEWLWMTVDYFFRLPEDCGPLLLTVVSCFPQD